MRKRKPVSKKSLRYMAATKRKGELLGLDFHKAYRILCRKIIKAYFILRGDESCFRCGEIITGDFHIDHKESWMTEIDPVAAFYNLRNITASHPICNSLARRHNYVTPEHMKIVGHKTRGKDGRFKKD